MLFEFCLFKAFRRNWRINDHKVAAPTLHLVAWSSTLHKQTDFFLLSYWEDHYQNFVYISFLHYWLQPPYCMSPIQSDQDKEIMKWTTKKKICLSIYKCRAPYVRIPADNNCADNGTHWLRLHHANWFSALIYLFQSCNSCLRHLNLVWKGNNIQPTVQQIQMWPNLAVATCDSGERKEKYSIKLQHFS